MSHNNKNEENERIKLDMLNIFNKVSNNSTIGVGHEMFSTLLKTYYTNDTKINYIIGILQDQINQIKKADKKEFLKLLSVASIKQLSKHISRYLTILQSCIADENSMIFTFIANIYGEIVDKIMNRNLSNTNNSNLRISNSQNYNLYSESNDKEGENANNNINQNTLYELFQGFCIYNMKQETKANQICGSLCLTSLIETCPNVLQPQYLKYLWENIMLFVDLPNYQAKSELLNSLISLIFAAENLFKPFATVTLYKILDYLTDNDWFKRKLALNVVYTLVIYCQEEIVSLKGHIIEFLKVLKSDKIKEVREVCLQTLKLFNDSKLYEDEKSLENIDNINNQDVSNNEQNNNFSTNYESNAINKKSKKESAPIPIKKSLRENLSPKHSTNTNNSFQNGEKSIVNEKYDKLNSNTNNNLKNKLKKNPYFEFSKNKVKKNTNDNSDINFDEDALLDGLNNKNKNSKNKDIVIKVARVSSNNNLGSRNLKTPSNNNNLNNSNIMNISSNTEGIKSTRNKSMKIGYNNLNKSRDKSFQIDNEEEKIEKHRNIRKRRQNRIKYFDNLGKSQEKDRKPKRSADYSIFKTQINPNFLKNAPKEEDGGIVIRIKDKNEEDNNDIPYTNKSQAFENQEMIYKNQDDMKDSMKSNQGKNKNQFDTYSKEEENYPYFENEENNNLKVTTTYSKSKPYKKQNDDNYNNFSNLDSNKLRKSKEFGSDKDYSFHEEKIYDNEDHTIKNDDILGDFINNYKDRSSATKENEYYKNSDIYENEKMRNNNISNNFNTSNNIYSKKYKKSAAYEIIKNNSLGSLQNSLSENQVNNISKISQNKKSSDKNINVIKNNNHNTDNSHDAYDSSLINNANKTNTKVKHFEDSPNSKIADEVNSHKKINNLNKNNNTSFSKNIGSNNISNNNINNNIHQENLHNNTSQNINYVVFDTLTEKNLLSNEEMTFNANNNLNNLSQINNLQINNNYISDILSQMKMISEKQNFIFEKMKKIEDNSTGQIYQMNTRIEKLENFIFQMMANKIANNNFGNFGNVSNLNHMGDFDFGNNQYSNSNYNVSFGGKPYQNSNMPSQANLNNLNSNGNVNNYQTQNINEFNKIKENNINSDRNNNNYNTYNAVKSNYPPKKNGNNLADIFHELKKNNPTEAFKIALRGEDNNLLKLIEKININLLKEVDENTINESIQKLLIILNRGEKILNITNFIKNIFVSINCNIKGFMVQNVKDSLHYILSNKQHFKLGEEEMIDINLILTNINNRKF